MSSAPVAPETEAPKDAEVAVPEKAFSKTSEFIPTAEPVVSRRDRTRTPSDRVWPSVLQPLADGLDGQLLG